MTESVGTEKPHLDIHFERALFVVGEQNSGKSKQLRSMFRDLRLGTKGVIPTKNRIDECYPLSVERWLYVRLTSPHEMDETPEDFLAKCQSKMCRNDQGARRWNFAGALQPTAYKQMPDAPSSVEAFIRHFDPERVRAVVLHPDRGGNFMSNNFLAKLVSDLQALTSTEVILTDAQTKVGNGLIYADFFDFT